MPVPIEHVNEIRDHFRKFLRDLMNYRQLTRRQALRMYVKAIHLHVIEAFGEGASLDLLSANNDDNL